MSAADTVGSLLAAIANLIHDGLRIITSSDARHWGQDEHEQVRALETALDEAKRDFQELSPLVNGQIYYENDRKHESINELRALRARFGLHVDNFREWSRAGGPINPIWARETGELRRELHRAQCRTARRIFTCDQEASSRCLGAFLVFRKQRAALQRQQQQHQDQQRQRTSSSSRTSSFGSLHGPPPHRTSEPPPARTRRGRSGSIYNRHVPAPAPPPPPPSSNHSSLDEERDWFEAGSATARRVRKQSRLEELVACNSVGRFERHGDGDVAFVCDFCDGHIVWEDLERMPTARTVDDEVEAAESDESAANLPSFSGQPRQASPSPLPRPPHRRSATVSSILSTASTLTMASTSRTSVPAWQATGFSRSSRHEKRIVFAPVAIANHAAPPQGEWLARLMCPICEPSGAGGQSGAAAAGATAAVAAGQAATATAAEAVAVAAARLENGGGSPEGSEDGGLEDPEELQWAPDESGFDDLAALQEHLEWEHGSAGVGGACTVM